MRARFLGQAALFAALAAIAASASAENADGAESAEPSRPGFENLRYEEDWSPLRGAARDDFFDPIKYIALDDDGEFWLSLGGQLRGRLEIWRNFQFGASLPEVDDSFFLARIRLHADLHLTKFVRVFAEFKSALASDRSLTGGQRPAEVDSAALQNAFVELKLPVGGVDLGVVGGRRELQFGAQRLVSPLDWANSRRTFDGAGAYASGDRWQVTSFWSRPVVVRKHDFNESSKTQQFYGIYSTFDLPVDRLGMDLYWLGISFDVARIANGTLGAGSRHTLGGRLFGSIPRTPLRIDLEGAVQVGNVASNDILAGMVSAMFTWPLDSLPLTPALFLGYDWASGDSASGGQVGTFDQLFPLGHSFLGFMDVMGRQNMQGLQGGVRVSPFRKAVFEMNWLAFWLDDLNDALYAANGAPQRPVTPTATSKYVGTEVDLTFKYKFIRGLAALVGYSHFFTGQYISDTGPDEDEDFGYIQLAYTF